jgi:hypothetical protein
VDLAYGQYLDSLVDQVQNQNCAFAFKHLDADATSWRQPLNFAAKPLCSLDADGKSEKIANSAFRQGAICGRFGPWGVKRGGT